MSKTEFIATPQSYESFFVKRIRDLEAELAEARRDRARLDAAERGKFSIRNNAMSDKWEVTTGDLHPAHRRSVSKKTLRAAIDAAMKEAQ